MDIFNVFVRSKIFPVCKNIWTVLRCSEMFATGSEWRGCAAVHRCSASPGLQHCSSAGGHSGCRGTGALGLVRTGVMQDTETPPPPPPPPRPRTTPGFLLILFPLLHYCARPARPALAGESWPAGRSRSGGPLWRGDGLARI